MIFCTFKALIELMAIAATRSRTKKTTKFTIDTLVEMMSRIGKPVTLAVG